MAKKKSANEGKDFTAEDEATIDAINRECEILTEDLNEFVSETYSPNSILITCAATIRNIFESPELKSQLHPFAVYMVMDRLAETLAKETVRMAIAEGRDHPIIEAVRKRYGSTK